MNDSAYHFLTQSLRLMDSQASCLKILSFITLFAVLFSACSFSPIEENYAFIESQAPEAPVASILAASATTPRIVFTSWKDGDSGIFIMNVDGTDQRQLTDIDTINFEAESFEAESQMEFIQAYNPTWSPDNQQIAFGFFGEIFVMDVDGSNIRQLTDGRGARKNPSWSPDGQQIAFNSNQDGDQEIWLMNADGTDLKQLTENQIIDDAPDWSPDGQMIVYRSGFPMTIYLMHKDGGNPRLLLDGNEGYGWEPAWSPDGKQIAYVSLRDGDDEIYVVNVDGSDLRQITKNRARDGSPAWSPDSKQLAFASDRDGDYEIYVMNVDGSNVRQLTDNDVRDYAPIWSSIP